MCGRYKLSRRKQIVEEFFDTAVSDDPEWNPRFNVAPTQPVPVIRQNLKEPIRELSLTRWGLIPRWAKDPSASAKMINARSETASMKPAFRDAMRFRRCLFWEDTQRQVRLLMKMHEFLKLVPPRPTSRLAHPLIMLPCLGQGGYKGAFRLLELTSNGLRKCLFHLS